MVQINRLFKGSVFAFKMHGRLYKVISNGHISGKAMYKDDKNRIYFTDKNHLVVSYPEGTNLSSNNVRKYVDANLKSGYGKNVLSASGKEAVSNRVSHSPKKDQRSSDYDDYKKSRWDFF